ncbi:MAG: hypothetical protein NTZ26_10130 [Candidatus Aminicenantes bacterium]|nr:hypothetical protein [Candidatus Aminicenantes bacterium]
MLAAALFIAASAGFGSLGSAQSPAAAPPSKPAGLESVVIVYKTHFDIGYSSTVHDVVHEYRTEMADRVLQAIEANRRQPKERQFVWTLSGWPMKQILWPGQAPERRRKIEQALRDGLLAVHAYPFTTHTETAEIEDLVRGLNISSTLARRYGRPLSISAKMSDVPGHSWILPTLFTHAGIRFYHMGGPQVNLALGLPPMFWWEGPDGSRLLTLYNNGYGSGALPPDGWPYKSWVSIRMTGDNQGPPEPETVGRDLDFYRRLGLKASVGIMDDFAGLILKEDLSRLPVVRSDIPDTWINGPMSQPEATRLAQSVRPAIGGVEALATLEKGWGLHLPDFTAAIGAAYESSLLYSEHTWGLANQHYIRLPYGRDWDALWDQGLPPQFRMMEDSWRDHAEYIRSAQRLMAEPYADAIAALADGVAVKGPRLIVYNPLPWTRDGEVVMDTRILPKFESLRPADGGPAVPISREYPAIEDAAPVTRFLARDIPPLGYRTFVASPEVAAAASTSADEANGVIESPYFRAALDAARGRIASLIDKRSGRELIDSAAPQGFGQYFYERFGYPDIAAWLAKSLYPEYVAHRFLFAAYEMPRESAYASALPAGMALSIRRSPLDVTAVMTGVIPGPGRPQNISIRLTLPAGAPLADLEVGWQKLPDSWPEAAWICLPFQIANPRFRLGRLGAVVDPVRDLTVDNANFHSFWLNTGAAVFDGDSGAGVGICPLDSPLVSLGVPGAYQFDKRYESANGRVYVQLYNNQWRTNFAAWIGDGGRMTSRVRLWTFDHFSPEAALYTPAMEARVALRAGRSRSLPGSLPVSAAGVTLSRKGVAVTAYGPNPDGAGTVFRVWEQGGTAGRLDVILPEGARFTTAKPVNLRGEADGKIIRVLRGRFSLDLPAYAPASFILR